MGVLKNRNAIAVSEAILESAEYQIRDEWTIKKSMGPKRIETLVRRSEITIETMTVTRIRRVATNSVNVDFSTEAISELVPETNEPPIRLNTKGTTYEK